ncbi:chalcone isomerase family protein [Desulfatiglans anilini]|uniref:chalcone isomerase family protein n=1 Tax=Desulfatiglans anilini TaxID=90728 RepID=UPI0003F67DCC|nr:chalcone isomerase family protein [Desulfatiglans anilini]
MMKRMLCAVLGLLLLPSLSPAFETGGVQFPLELEAGDRTLLLNGAGLRKKFVVKVYACALYLTAPNSSEKAILEADEPMAIRMQFIRGDIDPATLIETWNEGFSKTSGGITPSLQERIDAFNGCFTEKTREGDVWDLIYLQKEGVRVVLNQQLKTTIAGADFKKALFGIWLGDSPPSQDLKRGMLGNP